QVKLLTPDPWVQPARGSSRAAASTTAVSRTRKRFKVQFLSIVTGAAGRRAGILYSMIYRYVIRKRSMPRSLVQTSGQPEQVKCSRKAAKKQQGFALCFGIFVANGSQKGYNRPCV